MGNWNDYRNSFTVELDEEQISVIIDSQLDDCEITRKTLDQRFEGGRPLEDQMLQFARDLACTGSKSNFREK